MEGNKAVLEYSVEGAGGGSESWEFRFKDSAGHTLIESAKAFDSQAEAEMGFVSVIKLIASNQYTIRSTVLPGVANEA